MAEQPENNLLNTIRGLIADRRNPETNSQNALQELRDVQNRIQQILVYLQEDAPDDGERELILFMIRTLIRNTIQIALANENATPISFRRRVMNAIVFKLLSLSMALRRFVRDMSYRPRPGGPIHKYLFPPSPRAFLIDEKVSTEPHDECFICKEPYRSSRSKASSPIAAPQAPDHDEHLLAPGTCRAIKLQPCGHVVGDACFFAWMRARRASFGGRCPYCQQKIGLKPPTLLEKTKTYFSTSLILHFPDFVVATYFPRWMPDLPAASLKTRMLLLLMIGAYGGLWMGCLNAWLGVLLGLCTRGSYAPLVPAFHWGFLWKLLLAPVFATVLDHEVLRLLRVASDGIWWGVRWYELRRNNG